ncbi:hypothetical protein IKF92_00550 [Candidatus Saccharibacteria bacterium]|nr:hypothetical protein [Candidatus Saccharibacteria bacterium]
MDKEKAAYCDGLRRYYALQRQKYNVISAKELNQQIGEFLDMKSIKTDSCLRKWLLEDIFVDHPNDWQELGLNASNFVLDYIYNDEENSDFLCMYLTDFSKLPEGVSANQLIEALPLDYIFEELEGLDFWQQNGYDEYQEFPNCKSLMGIFLEEFEKAGGDMNLFIKKFVDAGGHFNTRGYRSHYYVAAALDLHNAGVPVDLTEVARNVDDMVYFYKGGYRTLWPYVFNMLDLYKAGAEVDLKKLESRVKRYKSKMTYDGYLILMEQLIEAGLKIDCTKFAKSVLADLDKAKDFKYQNYIKHSHPSLTKLLARHGVKDELIDQLDSRLE